MGYQISLQSEIYHGQDHLNNFVIVISYKWFYPRSVILPFQINFESNLFSIWIQL